MTSQTIRFLLKNMSNGHIETLFRFEVLCDVWVFVFLSLCTVCLCLLCCQFWALIRDCVFVGMVLIPDAHCVFDIFVCVWMCLLLQVCVCVCVRNVANRFFGVSVFATGDDMLQRRAHAGMSQIFEESQSLLIFAKLQTPMYLTCSSYSVWLRRRRLESLTRQPQPMCLCVLTAKAKLNKCHFHFSFVQYTQVLPTF